MGSTRIPEHRSGTRQTAAMLRRRRRDHKLDSTYIQQYLHFGDPLYWEQRYAQELKSLDGFSYTEWYVSFEDVLPFLQSLLQSTSTCRTLVVGCGRSKTCQLLYEHGFRELVAIDVSQSIVLAMQSHLAHLPGLEFAAMDIRSLSAFTDESFGLVIDKACMDVLFSNVSFNEDVRRACKEVYRVVKPGGIYVIVSAAPREARAPYFEAAGWRVEHSVVAQGEGIHLYILHKPTGTEDEVPAAATDADSKISHVESTKGVKRVVATTRSADMVGRLTVSESSELLGRLIEQARKEDEELEALKKAHKDRILALSRAKVSAAAVMDPDNVFDDEFEADDQGQSVRQHRSSLTVYRS